MKPNIGLSDSNRDGVVKLLTPLLADHEAVIKTLRSDLTTAQDKFSDAGTCDFLTGLMEKHEKMAWMLRAFSG